MGFCQSVMETGRTLDRSCDHQRKQTKPFCGWDRWWTRLCVCVRAHYFFFSWTKNMFFLPTLHRCLSVYLPPQLPADINKMHLTDHTHQQVAHVPSSQSGCSIASDSGSSSLSDIYQVGVASVCVVQRWCVRPLTSTKMLLKACVVSLHPCPGHGERAWGRGPVRSPRGSGWQWGGGGGGWRPGEGLGRSAGQGPGPRVSGEGASGPQRRRHRSV